MNIDEKELIAFSAGLLGIVLAFVIAVVLLGCEPTVEVDAVQIAPPVFNVTVVQCDGGPLDECELCWYMCGKTTAQIPTIYCSQACNELCNKAKDAG